MEERERVSQVCDRLKALGSEESEEARYLAALEVCDAALADSWSEVRKAAAKAVAKLTLAPQSRARLIGAWTARLVATDREEWRLLEGLCLAIGFLAQCATTALERDALLGAANRGLIIIALPHPSLAVRDAAAAALEKLTSSQPHEVSRTLLDSTFDELRGARNVPPARVAASPRVLHRIKEAEAAARAGLLVGLCRVVRVAGECDVLEAARGNVGIVVSMLEDEASTVRQAASTLLQRCCSASATLARLAVPQVMASFCPSSSWRGSEGALMTLDAVLGDEASGKLHDDRGSDVDALFEAATALLILSCREETSFEVRRAANQLGSTLARAELCFGRPLELPRQLLATEPELALRLISLATMHARYCAEALSPRARRWGDSHDGNGGDSESVETYEAAVATAVRERPEAVSALIANFHAAALQTLPLLEEQEDANSLARSTVRVRLIGFLWGVQRDSSRRLATEADVWLGKQCFATRWERLLELPVSQTERRYAEEPVVELVGCLGCLGLPASLKAAKHLLAVLDSLDTECSTEERNSKKKSSPRQQQSTARLDVLSSSRRATMDALIVALNFGDDSPVLKMLPQNCSEVPVAYTQDNNSALPAALSELATALSERVQRAPATRDLVTAIGLLIRISQREANLFAAVVPTATRALTHVLETLSAPPPTNISDESSLLLQEPPVFNSTDVPTQLVIPEEDDDWDDWDEDEPGEDSAASESATLQAARDLLEHLSLKTEVPPPPPSQTKLVAL